jgi:hypothetical protein
VIWNPDEVMPGCNESVQTDFCFSEVPKLSCMQTAWKQKGALKIGKGN